MISTSESTLDIGRLRHSAQIQCLGDKQDEYHQPVDAWIDVITPYGEFRSLTAKEQFVANQLSYQVTEVFTMRFVSTPIKSGMRLLADGKTYDIQAVIDPDHKRKVLKLFLLERSNA